MPYCPTRDEVYQSLLSLLPPGIAWQSGDAAGDVDSVIKRYLYGLSKPFYDVEVALCGSFDEMFVTSAIADRSEWLEEYGLPNDVDPKGAGLLPRLKARDSTEVSNYKEYALALGYITSMRWLHGDDVQFPGVVSTLRVAIDLASPAFSPPMVFDDITFDDGTFSGLDPVDLIGVLGELIPAEAAISWTTETHILILPRGSYSLTGTPTTLKTIHKLASGAGSYALTGTAATFTRTKRISAGAGSYALTGTAATFKWTHNLAVGSGSYALTGTAATLARSKTILAGASSYALTGTAATLRFGHNLASGTAGSYALTGTTATLARGNTEDDQWLMLLP